jgi:hypothetical protein
LLLLVKLSSPIVKNFNRQPAWVYFLKTNTMNLGLFYRDCNNQHGRDFMRFRMLGILLLLLSVWGIGQLGAQSTPTPQEDFAIRAAKAAKPDIGRPQATRYEPLGPTRSSTLGCELAASAATDLGEEVVPYRVEITYPGGVYVMHVTAGGSYTQLCDEKFGMDKVLGPQYSFVTMAYTIREVVVPQPSFPEGPGNPEDPVDPNFVPSPTNTPRPTNVPPPTATLFLGTPLAQDYVCPRGYTGYLVPRIRPGFQTASVAAGRVNNRLRAEPNTNGAVVTEAEPGAIFDKVITGPACFEGYVWWLVEINGVQGWTVESNAGDYFLEPQKGVTATPQPSNTPAPTSTLDPNIPTITPTLFLGTPLAQDYVCPPDFAGFSPTRLLAGIKTARVTEGGSANRLRSEPSSDGKLVGTAEPGITLDRVLAGPACKDGDVWWLVESGGARGWTIEARGSDYYLEPLPEFVYTATPSPTATIDPSLPTATLTPTATLFLGTPLAQDYVCPPDFAGYLPPRIKEGIQTARVTKGTVGNRLRTEPNVQSEQIGFVDAGVTIDRVLAGPACSHPYVWWLVESDGIIGWTVESDVLTNDYALDAMPGLTPTPSPSPTATSTLGATFTPSPTYTPSITPTLFLGTPLPETSICPPDFAGYLTPRLTPGFQMARVTDGGSANRLRSIPSTSGELLGEAEPGTIFDSVLTGPACGDEFVWWLVEVNGIVGWTVESKGTDYYVEPLKGTPFMTTPTVTVTPTNAG